MLRRTRCVPAVLLTGVLATTACVPRGGNAVWVVRSDLVAPGAPAQACTELEAAGADTVLAQVRGRGDAYYRSDLVPAAESLLESPGADPLAGVLAACRDSRVLAWLNAFYVWEGDAAPVSPGHLANAHPEWILRDADGISVAAYGPVERALGWIEGQYADPGHPGYRAHLVEVVAELAGRYPVQGVHLDFVRYPGAGYGQDGELGRTFAAAWNLDPRLIPAEQRVPDIARWLAEDTPPADRILATGALLWADLRAAQITAALRAVRTALDRVRPGIELSAAVFPDAGPAFVEKGQDWRGWVSAGLVDALYPMAYFGGAERVEAQLQEFAHQVKRLDGRVALWAGLGAHIKAPAQIAAEAGTARGQGYSGVSLFDYGTLRRGDVGLRPYLAAAAGPIAPGTPGPAGPMVEPPETPGGRRLFAVLDRVAGGRLPAAGDLGRTLDRRWAEFEAAAGTALPRVQVRLTSDPCPVPTWVEARGVFRYVHPDDGAERRTEQREKIEAARRRVLGGEAVAGVAAELSQGGTRQLGGVLGRRYLWGDDPVSVALRGTAQGEVSEVVEVSNGFWFYAVEQAGGGGSASYHDAPWPARRAAFRRLLSEEVQRLDQPLPETAAKRSEERG